ncbi:hypothetical protein GCM10027347_56100 [Larkinella harenae]
MNPQIWEFELYRRIGQVIVRYFLAAPRAFEPTLRDYQNWLDTIPPKERFFYAELGFQHCRALTPLGGIGTKHAPIA